MSCNLFCRRPSLVHLTSDMAHYSSSSANVLYAGDILVILDTVEAVTDQLRSELETVPTLDQRRALVTQVSFGLLKVWFSRLRLGDCSPKHLFSWENVQQVAFSSSSCLYEFNKL